MKRHAMLGSNLVKQCNIDTYRTWQQRRVAPAYMRGVPTWVWQSAINCGPDT